MKNSPTSSNSKVHTTWVVALISGFILLLGTMFFTSLQPNNSQLLQNSSLLKNTLPKAQPYAVEGALCGDGSPARMDITNRTGSTNLLIYLDGGGACFSEKTCGCSNEKCTGSGDDGKGTTPMSAPSADKSLSVGDWNNGGDIGSAAPWNPMNNQNFSVAEIAYCTGDLFSGNKTTDYSTDPAIHEYVNHYGSRNLELFLAKLKQMYPNPTKLVFAGGSAGGDGVAINIQLVKKYFPSPTSIYAIGDSGLPFAPGKDRNGLWTQDYPADVLKTAFSVWGIENTQVGQSIQAGEDGVKDVADIVRYNGKQYPDVRYAFLSEWNDFMMTGVASMMKSPNSDTAVANVMRKVKANRDADNSSSTKFFYIPGNGHVLLNLPNARPFSTYKTTGITLKQWLSNMINDSSDWNDVIVQ